MKPGIHPDYRDVVFRDRAGGLEFLSRSTATSTRTVEWSDGRTYPVVDVDVSSATHPFWTGRKNTLDTAGRVEKFERRFGRRTQGSASEEKRR
ncbi:type B 50S ribosomal protein L31 [Mariniluteicoccus flavus]